MSHVFTDSILPPHKDITTEHNIAWHGMTWHEHFLQIWEIPRYPIPSRLFDFHFQRPCSCLRRHKALEKLWPRSSQL